MRIWLIIERMRLYYCPIYQRKETSARRAEKIRSTSQPGKVSQRGLAQLGTVLLTGYEALFQVDAPLLLVEGE